MKVLLPPRLDSSAVPTTHFPVPPTNSETGADGVTDGWISTEPLKFPAIPFSMIWLSNLVLITFTSTCHISGSVSHQVSIYLRNLLQIFQARNGSGTNTTRYGFPVIPYLSGSDRDTGLPLCFSWLALIQF